MATAPVLSLTGVVKRYGKHAALDRVDLSIEEGSFVGLLGPNGAGKTTLFQVVAGLFAADQGEVRLFGKTHRESGSEIRSRIGLVFQSLSVDLDLSVHANLRFHGRLFGLSGRALGNRIDEVCDQFGLTDLIGTSVRNLSGGQRRKVEIARALINKPDLLLMDEASAGLDPPSRLNLLGEIRELSKEQNVTVLWASHLVDEMSDTDDIIVLNSGKVVANGSPEQLMRETGATDLIGAYACLTNSKINPVSSA